MGVPARSHAEDRLQHLTLMYAALTAINEAMLHARSAPELYQRVCEAAVESGDFSTTAVVLASRDSSSAEFVASAGVSAEYWSGVRISLDPALPEGRGLIATALHTRRPVISDDYLADDRTRPWHAVSACADFGSSAAVPIFQSGEAIGVLLFTSVRKRAFGEDVVRLIERMAAGIVYALEKLQQDDERKLMEQALRVSEARYRTILETMDDAYCEVDLTGRHEFFNQAFCRMLGYPREVLLASTNREYQTPQMAQRVAAAFTEVYRTGISKTHQVWEYIHRNGQVVQVEGSVQLRRDASGTPTGFASSIRDISSRWKMEQALRESEARFRALTNLSSDWYWEQDASFRIVRMESRHTGPNSPVHPLVGKFHWDSGFELQDPGGWEAFRELLEAHRPFRNVVMHRLTRHGEPYFVSVSAEPMFDSEGRFAGYRGISREITDQKVAEERIRHLATHDGLTGLPNRVMFSQVLGVAIPSAKRYSRRLAVLFIDLDHFKEINDTLGHDAGDTLLREITARFRLALRASDVIARLGGDEFVVLLQDVSNPDQVAIVARKIMAAATVPVVLMGQECRVTASIGIAMYPDDGTDEQSLMKNADIAMYHAKQEGKNNFQFFSKEIRSLSLERMTMESNLRLALERGEFSLHYQPKVNLSDRRIIGVEALLRWQCRNLGAVPPSRFIPVAEETGLIVSIGMWALRTACEQNVAWQRAGLDPVCMAVNLSVRQFGDDQLIPQIAEVLRDTGMAPELLELEITEGMVVHDPERAIRILGDIKAMGVRLAIDDFGSGYSSLGQLKHFPIDTLKVDRSFIRDLHTSAEDKAITQAIIAMGKTLRLTVVAEGVETTEQQDFLREHRCDQMQGFLFSRPVIAGELEALLRGQQAE